jgi:ribose-phosphate pyrophosphokinase
MNRAQHGGVGQQTERQPLQEAYVPVIGDECLLQQGSEHHHCDGYVIAARNHVFAGTGIRVGFGNVHRVDQLTTPSPNDSIAVFAPTATGVLGAKVAAALGMALSPHEEQEFTGREYKARPLQSVRDRSVYVVQSLFGDSRGSANDRLCQLLFLIGTLKDAGAARVTACVPYLAYARQDRRTEARDPITVRYMAQLFEAMGMARVVALEVHNLVAFDNAFRCHSVHLEATTLFVQHFAAQSADHEFAVVSPDIGGVKRARHFQERLEEALGRTVNFALMDKKRSRGVVSGTLFAGYVGGRCAIVVDDLISSGTTAARAISACRREGAVRVEFAATHASFAAEARRLFDHDPPDKVLVTDSVDLGDDFRPYLQGPLAVLSVAPLIAEAIRGLENGGSPSEFGGL